MQDKGRPEGWVEEVQVNPWMWGNWGRALEVKMERRRWVPNGGISCKIRERDTHRPKLIPGMSAILIAAWRRRKLIQSEFSPKPYWVGDSYFRVYVPILLHTYTLRLRKIVPMRGTWEDYRKR